MSRWPATAAFVVWILFGCRPLPTPIEAPATSVAPPDAPAASNAVTALTLGILHQCALYEGGTVRCRGANEVGELGVRHIAWSSTPVLVSSLQAIEEIGATTVGATCARDHAGGVWCWGSNISGEIGNGHVDDEACAAEVGRPVACRREPTRVRGIPPARRLAVGDTGACIVATDDSVWCWGGVRSDAPSGAATPTRIGSFPSIRALSMVRNEPVITLATGRVVTRAPLAIQVIDPDATLTTNAWGGGDFCVLHADRSMTCSEAIAPSDRRDSTRPTPRVVETLREVKQVVVGPHHRCVLFARGTVQCRGANWWGEVGVSPRPAPTPSATVRVDDDARTEGEVANLDHVRAVFVGSNTSCAIRDDQTVWCWGRVGADTTHVPTRVAW